MSNKARYWWGVLYPENMYPTWQEDIADILQVPFCYAIHDIDKDSKSESRKTHVHLIICFANTTTYKHAFESFNRLSAEGKQALNKIEACYSIRHCYDYLIHDTDGCRSKGKELYDKSLRITGNNFDIGSFEQISTAEIKEMRYELSAFCVDNLFTNISDFWLEVNKSFDRKYLDILETYSALYERLCKGNFLNEWKNNKI